MFKDDDEALGEFHAHATYAPHDIEGLRRMYAAMTPRGRALARAGYEAIGKVLNGSRINCSVCRKSLDGSEAYHDSATNHCGHKFCVISARQVSASAEGGASTRTVDDRS